MPTKSFSIYKKEDLYVQADSAEELGALSVQVVTSPNLSGQSANGLRIW